MKNRIAYAVGALAMLSLAASLNFACSRSGTRSNANMDMKTVQIPIAGMVCGSCVSNVKRGLKAQQGVAEVEVSLEKRQARVRYNSLTTNPERLAKIIRDLGYTTGMPAPVTR